MNVFPYSIVTSVSCETNDPVPPMLHPQNVYLYKTRGLVSIANFLHHFWVVYYHVLFRQK